MDPVNNLRKVHASLADHDSPFRHLAPGVTPGIDLSSLNLHAVRETALGAYADLDWGELASAHEALRAVLAAQWREPGTPWHGTFPTVNEQPTPATGAVEWSDFDPNWRQFVGVTLALCVADFAHLLDPTVVVAIHVALTACVEGEPLDRIPDWYTNPQLLAAWLDGFVGQRLNRPEFVERGLERLRRVTALVDRDGDIAEYNSPTYDGIDLFACALCEQRGATAAFRDVGQRLRTIMQDRVATLWHRDLGVIAGPYLRTYGLRLTDYVSLTGLWLTASANATGVLPVTLDASTDHVHDLYFAPLFRRYAPPWSPPSLPFPRRHVQTFGDVVATSLLTASGTAGLEVGRRHTFARDQYFPLMAHQATEGGVAFVALQLPSSVTVTEGGVDDTGVIHGTCEATDEMTFTLRSSGRRSDEGDPLGVEGFTLAFDPPVDEVTTTDAPHGEAATLRWATSRVVRFTVSPARLSRM
jgi:hypothetical protein